MSSTFGHKTLIVLITILFNDSLSRMHAKNQSTDSAVLHQQNTDQLPSYLLPGYALGKRIKCCLIFHSATNRITSANTSPDLVVLSNMTEICFSPILAIMCFCSSASTNKTVCDCTYHNDHKFVPMLFKHYPENGPIC